MIIAISLVIDHYSIINIPKQSKIHFKKGLKVWLPGRGAWKDLYYLCREPTFLRNRIDPRGRFHKAWSVGPNFSEFFWSVKVGHRHRVQMLSHFTWLPWLWFCSICRIRGFRIIFGGSTTGTTSFLLWSACTRFVGGFLIRLSIFIGDTCRSLLGFRFSVSGTSIPSMAASSSAISWNNFRCK